MSDAECSRPLPPSSLRLPATSVEVPTSAVLASPPSVTPRATHAADWGGSTRAIPYSPSQPHASAGHAIPPEAVPHSAWDTHLSFPDYPSRQAGNRTHPRVGQYAGASEVGHCNARCSAASLGSSQAIPESGQTVSDRPVSFCSHQPPSHASRGTHRATHIEDVLPWTTVMRILHAYYAYL